MSEQNDLSAIRHPNRVKHSYTQSISGTPDQVFPLLCPVRELESLAFTDEVERVLADHVTASERHHTDFIPRTSPDLAAAPMSHHAFGVELLRDGNDLGEPHAIEV